MPSQFMEGKSGTVYWITGLAGAGKTTMAGLLVAHLQAKGVPTILLDGDAVREVLGGTAGHTPAERLVLAGRYGAMCRLISCQGISVVCATISMFHEVRRRNRETIDKYCEIYLQVSLEELTRRDQKGLYRDAQAGRIDNVLGVNATFEEPDNSDIILVNNGQLSPETMLKEMLEKINLWSGE